jgi:hypothetical protein
MKIFNFRPPTVYLDGREAKYTWEYVGETNDKISIFSNCRRFTR